MDFNNLTLNSWELAAVALERINQSLMNFFAKNFSEKNSDLKRNYNK